MNRGGGLGIERDKETAETELCQAPTALMIELPLVV